MIYTIGAGLLAVLSITSTFMSVYAETNHLVDKTEYTLDEMTDDL